MDMDQKSTMKAKKKKFSLSGIDIMIILLIILCVVGLVIRNGLIDSILKRTDLSSAEIGFSVSSVTQEVADSVKTGDTVTMLNDSKRSKDSKLGQIKSVSKTSALTLVEKGDGTPERVTDERLRDMTGTITVSGKMTDSGYMLNGDTYIAAGSKFSVTSGNAVFEILITSVRTSG